MNTAFDLDRFITAQENLYSRALSEIKTVGKKAIGCGSSFRRSMDWDLAA